MSTPELSPVEIVYVGTFRVDEKRATGGLGFLTKQQVDAGAFGAPSVFDPKGRVPFLMIGALYSADGTVGADGHLNTLGVSSAKPVGGRHHRVVSEEVARTWGAADEANKLALRSVSAAKAALADTALTRTVADLRIAYIQIRSSAARNAFKVWLLNQLDSAK